MAPRKCLLWMSIQSLGNFKRHKIFKYCTELYQPRDKSVFYSVVVFENLLGLDNMYYWVLKAFSDYLTEKLKYRDVTCLILKLLAW